MMRVLIAAVLLAAARFEHDHDDSAYRAVLERFVHPPRVDYAGLKSQSGDLDAAVRSFAAVPAAEERAWPRNDRIAFWTNAYNAFTLRAIVDHYPIQGSFFSRSPRNSIRQIDGVWTKLTWQAAGRRVTLDDIEHRILRPELKDPRVHFALTCASVGCPPLRAEPYRAADLDRQLDEAARIYLGSAEGLRLDGNTLRVSSIFKWYGDDFVERYAGPDQRARDPRERAILGVIAQFGPPAAAAKARDARATISYLDYDWSLNDIASPR